MTSFLDAIYHAGDLAQKAGQYLEWRVINSTEVMAQVHIPCTPMGLGMSASPGEKREFWAECEENALERILGMIVASSDAAKKLP